MTTLDPNLVETLLHMAESDVLDFKRDQYPLAGATDEQKSEFLKDILAFSNAWKSGDAHIFVGADENAGQRATITGVSTQLNDANLQQLVNTKTNVPVAFEYIPVTVDAKPAAVIRIRKEQQRPVFLQKAFGRLKPNVVYVRRGSSTAEAAPDEIARMGAAAVAAVELPVLAIELADPDERRSLGRSVALTSRVLVARPPLPPEVEALQKRIVGEPLLAIRAMALTSRLETLGLDRPDPAKLAKYLKERGLLSRLGFYVHNVGQVLVKDVRIVLEIPKSATLRVAEELPVRPRGALEIRARALTIRGPRTTDVNDLGSAWEVVARFDKIQPNAKGWSKPFWIGSEERCELPLIAQVYGDNVRTTLEIPLRISIDVQSGFIEHHDDDNDCDR